MYTTPQLHESAGTIDGLRAKLQAQAAELQRLSKVELQLAEEAERSRQLRTQSGALQATNDSLTMRVEVMRRQEAAAAEEGVQLRKRSKLLDEDNAQLLRLMQERSSSFETERDALERQVPPHLHRDLGSPLPYATSAPGRRLAPCHIRTAAVTYWDWAHPFAPHLRLIRQLRERAAEEESLLARLRKAEAALREAAAAHAATLASEVAARALLQARRLVRSHGAGML
jgi:hypothetical protein